MKAIHILFVLRVINSCKTLDQLENANQWAQSLCGDTMGATLDGLDIVVRVHQMKQYIGRLDAIND